jgi:stage V sporulation protein D (sporulation-specific penicillin-binding protein)
MPEISTDKRKHIAKFFVFLLLLLLFLAGRIAWVQFVDGKHLTERSAMQLQESKALQSPRGAIYDRNGRELAISSMTKSVYANPAILNKEPAELANLLAPALEMKPAVIKERLTQTGNFVWLKRTLENDKAQEIAALIKQYKLTGLEFIEESKRYYPNDSLAAHVLGFVGTDDIGLDGIENSMDKVIKGELIQKVFETDSHGIPIFKSIFAYTTRNHGKSVTLTLDSTIQFIVERSLDAAMARTHAQAATVIIMNPKTGEILAMASRPGYNPNYFYQYGEREWKNRAVSNIYEPGSTFKSIVAAAALQENVVRPNDTFIDRGYVEVSGRRIQNWSGDGYGRVPFVDIIKYSINTGFVQVGMKLGAAKLNDYVRAFGFGKITGIELPGEEEGLLFHPRDMKDSDLATMSIGQSVAVTPLQLLTAVSAIANNGVLLKPHIIRAIDNADQSSDQLTVPEPIRQVISPATAQELIGLLEKVISEGGGQKGAVKGYHFAGKTGTAEKLRQDGGGYETGHYIASFVGFGPVEDPQIAALVIIDDPVGSYYGSEIAAPIFSEIITQVMRYLNIRPPAPPAVAMQPLPSAASPAFTTEKATAKPAPPGKRIVPDVRGQTMREAAETLNSQGLAFLPVGSGIAVRQNVSAYSAVDPGTEVIVYFEAR